MASTYGSPSQLAGWAYGCAWYVLWFRRCKVKEERSVEKRCFGREVGGKGSFFLTILKKCFDTKKKKKDLKYKALSDRCT